MPYYATAEADAAFLRQYAADRKQHVIDLDRKIAAERANMPSAANVVAQSRAAEAAYIQKLQTESASHNARLDRNIAVERANIPSPADMSARSAAIDKAYLENYKARLETHNAILDAAIAERRIQQKSFNAKSWRDRPNPAPSGINQNDTYRPPNRPSSVPRKQPTTVPQAVAAAAGTATAVASKASGLGGRVASQASKLIPFAGRLSNAAAAAQALDASNKLAGALSDELFALPKTLSGDWKGRQSAIEAFQKDREKRWNKSPLNPFGDAYDWAPWNDRKSPNSLNPLPQKDMSGFDDTGYWPIEPKISTPVPFTALLKTTANRYDGGVVVLTAPVDFSTSATGIPVGFYKNKINIYITEIGVTFVDLNGQTQQQGIFRSTEGPNFIPGFPEGDYFFNFRPQIIGPQVEPKKTQAPIEDLKPIADPTPNREIFPQPAPQFEPEGRPEYPRFPQPDRAPQPQRSPSPSPSPQPSPAPQPMPNQPAPIPLPAIDPTAAPTGNPKPRFDPAPAPGPIGRPSPVPNPSNKPFPGKQKNPGDYHFEYYDEGYKAPEIVKEKQKEQQQNKQNQYQPNPSPQPNPEPNPEPNPNPLPAPDFDACKDPCIADMHDQSKSQKPKKIEYKLFKKCGDNGPEFETKTLNVPENQAEALKILLDDAADRKGEKCTLEANTLTIPEWWAVRPGANRSQMVILYAEVLKTGKLTTSRWQTTIPHYNRPEGAKPSIPSYKKGNVMGTLTLNDNSKIRINASTSSECKKVINKLKILIPVPLRTNNGKAIKPTILEREDGSQKEVNVVPIRGDFYKTGQQSGRPDWSINLRGK